MTNRRRAMFEFLEGDRTFQLIYGFVTGAACFSVAIPMLWWILPGRKRSFFGIAVDPNYRLQCCYGIFTMAMACTDIGCRLIPHGELEFVHPAFFLMTLLLVGAFGPRLIVIARAPIPPTA